MAAPRVEGLARPLFARGCVVVFEAAGATEGADLQSGRTGMAARTYGERIEGLLAGGRPVRTGVFDERQVRAAAGVTMALGAVAFAFAALAREYRPIQLVTAFFAVEFLLRVAFGLRHSPVGRLARLLTRGQAPEWASARPKRFAWSLGLAMSLAMTAITNSGIRGPLPFTICSVCLALMWLEAVLGLCLGCAIHRALVRRGWLAHEDGDLCSGGSCRVEEWP